MIVSLAHPACLGASRAMADTLQIHGRLAVSHATKTMVSNADQRGMDVHCFSIWGIPPGEFRPFPGEFRPFPGEFRPFPGEFRPRSGPESSEHWTRTRCQECPACREGLKHHQAFPEITKECSPVNVLSHLHFPGSPNFPHPCGHQSKPWVDQKERDGSPTSHQRQGTPLNRSSIQKQCSEVQASRAMRCLRYLIANKQKTPAPSQKRRHGEKGAFSQNGRKFLPEGCSRYVYMCVAYYALLREDVICKWNRPSA